MMNKAFVAGLIVGFLSVLLVKSIFIIRLDPTRIPFALESSLFPNKNYIHEKALDGKYLLRLRDHNAPYDEVIPCASDSQAAQKLFIEYIGRELGHSGEVLRTSDLTVSEQLLYYEISDNSLKDYNLSLLDIRSIIIKCSYFEFSRHNRSNNEYKVGEWKSNADLKGFNKAIYLMYIAVAESYNEEISIGPSTYKLLNVRYKKDAHKFIREDTWGVITYSDTSFEVFYTVTKLTFTMDKGTGEIYFKNER